MSAETAQIEELHWRLRHIENRFAVVDAPSYPRFWTERNLTEPQVQYALEDLCKGSSIVFDVGANFGGLSLTMSRAVGPRGAVCAFEANPSIAEMCQHSLNHWGCFNTQLYNNAVFSDSGSEIDLYLSSNMVGDSVINKVSDRSVKVDTIALDDFIRRTGLGPDLIKMDIEGAEYDALQGMRDYIGSARPTFILEQRPEDEKCIAFLKEAGYLAVDLRSYRWLETMQDLPAGTIVTDILYMTQEAIEATPYGSTSKTPEFVARLESGDVHWSAETHCVSRDVIELPAGRYLVSSDFQAASPTLEMKCGISNGVQALMHYHGTSGWLAQVGRNWVVDLKKPTKVSAFFDFPSGRDDSFVFNSLEISRLPGFPMTF